MKNNSVSIILPTYNGAVFIEKAIQSVTAQTYTNWELLVIDDGSIDDTQSIVRAYEVSDPRIKYTRNESNLGIQKTLNKGLAMAQGIYIARIDDDDRWHDTEKLQKQVAHIEQNPSCVLVGTGVVVIDECEKEVVRYLVPETDQAIRSQLLGKNCFVHSSVLFRKDIAQGVGGYDETTATRHVEDWDLWLRLGTKGMLANLPTYSVSWMLRNGNISSINKLAQFKKGIALAQKYKKYYSGYKASLMRSYARYVIYGVVMNTPIKSLLTKGIAWYKKHW